MIADFWGKNQGYLSGVSARQRRTSSRNAAPYRPALVSPTIDGFIHGLEMPQKTQAPAPDTTATTNTALQEIS